MLPFLFLRGAERNGTMEKARGGGTWADGFEYWREEDLELLVRVLRLVVMEPSEAKTRQAMELARELFGRLEMGGKCRPEEIGRLAFEEEGGG